MSAITPLPQLAVRFGQSKRVVAVASFREASEAWCRLRDENDLGASQSPKVTVINLATGELVADCLNMPCAKLAIENPIGCATRRIGQLVTGGKWVVKRWTEKKTCDYQQRIQPYEFGDDASKATCLWLKGLPPLLIDPARYVAPRTVCRECGACQPAGSVLMFANGCPECGAKASRIAPRWANQTDSGQNKLPPTEDRGILRSETYPGIARAIAEQWGR